MNGVAKFPSWQLLTKLITYRPIDYAILIGQTLIFYAVELVPGFVLQRIFNWQPAADIPDAVWLALAVLLGATLARWLTIPAWFWAEARFSVWAGTLLRRNMLAHVLSRPGARALPGSAGEAISRFRDDATESLSFLSLVPDMPLQVITLISMLLVMARINLPLTLVAAVPVLISVVAAQLAGGVLQRNKKLMQESIGAVTGSLGEIFGAVQSIKLAGVEPHVGTAFARIGEQRRTAILRVTLLLKFLNSLSYNSAAFATAAVLVAAVFSGELQRMSPGDLALFVTFLGGLNFLVGFFGELVNRYRQTEISLRRMVELMLDAKPQQLVQHHRLSLGGVQAPIPDDAPRALPLQALAVKGLHWTYPGSAAGIRDCSFDLQRGSMTVITGRVGSGKSTLLRGLLGLLPAGGDVRWNGELLTQRDQFLRPPHCAYVPQVPRLFSDSLRENILMGFSAVRLDAAIHTAVLERDLAEFSQGLDTLVGVRGTKVSGGQLQRTAAARALVRQPDLLVVDDLSSALDVETEVLIWQRIFAQTGEQTVLAVSHRAPALERASHIIVMKDGRILDQGTLADLLERCAEMREIYQT